MASEQEKARKPSVQEVEERRENASDNLESAKWMAHVAKDASTEPDSSTLGSLKEGTMSALKGIQEKFEYAKDSTVGKTQEVKDTTAEKAKETKDSTMNKAEEYKDTAAEKARQTKDSVADTTRETADTTVNKSHEYTDSAAQKAKGTKDTAMEKTQAVKDVATEKALEAKDTVAGKTQEAKDSSMENAKGSKDRTGQMAQETSDATRGKLGETTESMHEKMQQLKVGGQETMDSAKQKTDETAQQAQEKAQESKDNAIDKYSNSSSGPILNAMEHYEIVDTHPATYLEDINAIDAIKTSFDIKSWIFDPCFANSWDGIGCDKTSSFIRILEINLPRMNLTGSVPQSIGQLTALVNLSLDNNHLTGPLPNFTNLTMLERLHLQNNSLNGSIPDWLAGVKNLKELYASVSLFYSKLALKSCSSPFFLSTVIAMKDSPCGFAFCSFRGFEPWKAYDSWD